MSDPVEESVTADIHVYVVPPLLWNNDLNTAFSDLFKQTVSAGIVRPNLNQTLSEFRREIENQLGFQFLPKDYVFCKNVGHSLGRIRPHQESLFQVKEFLPPLTNEPEIYVIDLGALVEETSKPPTPDATIQTRARSLSVRPIEPANVPPPNMSGEFLAINGQSNQLGQQLFPRGSLVSPGIVFTNIQDSLVRTGSNMTYNAQETGTNPNMNAQAGQQVPNILVSSPIHPM
ncbi:unnamed protein product [Echinostoma caproni]|uniref:Mediator of RNA polymerase II transcription subunit 25 n=1 Tax=Echinostoma caproni TaxID=27848 RepID=A0A183ACD8_9TREM|nr:unnamed protein product [Echinostoma caproni]